VTGVRDGRLFVYVLDAIARPSRSALAAHAAYVRSLDDSVVAAGTFRHDAGAIVCLVAASELLADEIARTDPLVAFGLALYRVHEIETIDQLREDYAAALH
jgi:hypothetical protein